MAAFTVPITTPLLRRTDHGVSRLALIVLTCLSTASLAGWSKVRYSEEEAKMYSKFARLSFCSAEHLKKWSCGEVCEDAPGKPQKMIFLGPGKTCKVSGFIAKDWSDDPDSPECIISFRGSVNLWNYMADGEAWISPWPWPTGINLTLFESMPDWSNLASPPYVNETNLVASTMNMLKDKAKKFRDDFHATVNSTLDAAKTEFGKAIRAGKPFTNISSQAPWCEDCAVHRGFACAYQEIRERMLEGLKELQCRSTALVGHSLGGATATLATLELRGTFKPSELRVGPVYVFGSPRVGNDNVAKAFEKWARRHDMQPSIWRIVHYYDPIVRIPSRPTFAHVGQEVYYDEAFHKYRVCKASPPFQEDPECSNGIPLWKCALSEHRMDHLRYFNESFNHFTMGTECLSLLAPVLPNERRLQEQTRPSLLV